MHFYALYVNIYSFLIRVLKDLKTDSISTKLLENGKYEPTVMVTGYFLTGYLIYNSLQRQD